MWVRQNTSPYLFLRPPTTLWNQKCWMLLRVYQSWLIDHVIRNCRVGIASRKTIYYKRLPTPGYTNYISVTDCTTLSFVWMVFDNLDVYFPVICGIPFDYWCCFLINFRFLGQPLFCPTNVEFKGVYIVHVNCVYFISQSSLVWNVFKGFQTHDGQNRWKIFSWFKMPVSLKDKSHLSGHVLKLHINILIALHGNIRSQWWIKSCSNMYLCSATTWKRKNLIIIFNVRKTVSMENGSCM